MRARLTAVRACCALAWTLLAAAAYAQNGDSPWATIEGGPGTGCATDATQWVDDLVNGRDVKDLGDDLLPLPAERLQ